MYRIKDFVYKDVYDKSGKRFGIVRDIIFDYKIVGVSGFEIKSNSLLKGSFVVPLNSVIYYNKNLIIERREIQKKLGFTSIKCLDIIDINGNMLGVLDDIIFDKVNFKIKGLVASAGIIKNYLFGKKILLLSDIIIGDESILFIKKYDYYRMTATPHNICLEECKYEE